MKMQSRFRTILCGLMLISTLSISCGGGGEKVSRGLSVNVKDSGLVSEGDSLAYIIGMSVAEQLQKVDTMLNLEIVCRAILEQSEGSAVMNNEDAKMSYLRYLLYVEPERRRGYEEKYLADLAAGDRTFTRTKSGLTYHIEVIGDESLTPRNSNDWITISYTISRIGGEEIVVNHTESLALSDFIDGVQESIKLIGKGGKITSLIPSVLAYGENGNEEFGIEPIETLLYKIEIVDVEKGSALKRKKELEKF